MKTTWHDIIARPFGRALEEDGRLDFDKASLGEVFADKPRGIVIKHQVALHSRTSQVEIAIAQPDGLIHFGLTVDVEHRELGDIQDLKLMGDHLDIAREHFGIVHSLGPQSDLPRDAHHILDVQF